MAVHGRGRHRAGGGQVSRDKAKAETNMLGNKEMMEDVEAVEANLKPLKKSKFLWSLC